MDERSLYVGFDLCEDYSAISCFNPKTFEPEPICIGRDPKKHLIPTLLGMSLGGYSIGKEWFFGEDAIEKTKDGAGIIIDGLLKKVEEGEEVAVLGTYLSPIFLLERFLKKTLLLIKQYYPKEGIKFLVITVKDMRKPLVEGIKTALSSLGIESDRMAVISHISSYEYYALSQGKELWMNDVALFDFDKKGLGYYQLSVSNRQTPHVVKVSSKDFSETLEFDMLSEYEEEPLQYVFENIAKNVLHKQVISTVYVNGIGFRGEWADKVLVKLCAGRRIFKGENLYTQGACYGARELGGEGKLQPITFLSDEMIGKDISLLGYYNGRQSEIILEPGITPWFMVSKKLDVILDGEDTISITLTDVVTRQKNVEQLKLTGLLKGVGKGNRIELRIKCISPSKLIITAKDKGFGEFSPSSSRIWEREVHL